MKKEKDYNYFQQDLEMLKYFQEEFFFRQKYYWTFLAKSFFLTVGISAIPIVSEIFGIVPKEIPHPYRLFFPLLGLIISIFSLILLLKNAKKMNSVNNAKYRINRLMSSRYHYEFRNDNVGKKDIEHNTWLSTSIVWIAFFLEIAIIAIIVALLIL